MGVMVDPGMSEEAIIERFSDAGPSAAALIHQMHATGNAGDLRALEGEPAVQSVSVRPPKVMPSG
jgi:hypothetical protein